jgi:hypothetical protein
MRNGAASTFVTHSPAAGALAQDPEVGAMARSIDAAEVPAWREESRVNDVGKIAEADAVTPKRKMRNIKKNIIRVLRLLVWEDDAGERS